MTHARRDPGFTFLEVMVSTALFLFMASGLVAATMTAIKASKLSRETAVAAALVHDRIEEIRALEPLDLQELEDGSQMLDSIGQEVTDGGKYLRSWTVTHDSPVQGTSTIHVIVAWEDPLPREVEAVAYYCETSSCS